VGDERARDEDDHDLLTFSESAIRLRTEIALTEAALRESTPRSAGPALEARLSALTDALGRNPGRLTPAPEKKASSTMHLRAAGGAEAGERP